MPPSQKDAIADQDWGTWHAWVLGARPQVLRLCLHGPTRLKADSTLPELRTHCGTHSRLIKRLAVVLCALSQHNWTSCATMH